MKVEQYEQIDRPIDSSIRKAFAVPLRQAVRRDPNRPRWLLIREDDVTVAACLLNVWGEWASIEGIWVSPPRRRQGLGTQLLASAEEFARAQGLRGLEATIRGLNKPSFFLSAGFQAVGQLESSQPELAKAWFVKSFTPLKLAFPGRRAAPPHRAVAAGPGVAPKATPPET